MKLPCAVTRDLLPLYAEELVEQETRTLIEEHLTGCSACRAKLSELKTETSAPIETAKPLQSLKKQLQKRCHRCALRFYRCLCMVLSRKRTETGFMGRRFDSGSGDRTTPLR